MNRGSSSATSTQDSPAAPDSMNLSAPMVVSDPLAAFAREGMIKVLAPAKVNLFLGIGKRLASGFHEATTVIHALSLHDTLHMDYVDLNSTANQIFGKNVDKVEHENTKESDAEVMYTGGLQINLTMYAREGLPELKLSSEDNLVVKAIRQLAEKLGREGSERIDIRLEKHIPTEAGLGGGSSDAAAALVGAAKFWGIDPAGPEVLEVAAEIGSDVSFFLYGGCICLTGRGERFDHKLEAMKKPLVLIKPEGGVSTEEAYRLFDENPSKIPLLTMQDAVMALQASDVPLYNNLAEAAQVLLPATQDVRAWAEVQQGVEGILLSGSGSATFLICESFSAAYALSSAAQARGWWARTTSFSSLRASMV